MAVIDIKDLEKSYGKTKALKGIDLTVYEGEVYGFIGMNGAGKSTTIRILLGMLKPDGGQVKLLEGDPFKDCVDIHRRIAYVPSDINLWGNLSGGEVIDLLAGMRGNVNEKRRAELIERFQLDPSKKCKSYSKGNRQKVVLIAALMSDAELYIFDEPTSGLDPLMEIVFQEYVKELAAKGKTIFLSSHILSEVEKICDRVSIIKEGRIVESGKLRELQQFSFQYVVAQCRESPADLQPEGVSDLCIDGTKISFRVSSGDLNRVLRRLTDFEILSLQCTSPKLEEVFLHHYEKDGELS